MRRFWVWFGERVLPVWAREALVRQIRELERENLRLRGVVAERENYIQGLRWAVKQLRRGSIKEGKE